MQEGVPSPCCGTGHWFCCSTVLLLGKTGSEGGSLLLLRCLLSFCVFSAGICCPPQHRWKSRTGNKQVPAQSRITPSTFPALCYNHDSERDEKRCCQAGEEPSCPLTPRGAAGIGQLSPTFRVQSPSIPPCIPANNPCASLGPSPAAQTRLNDSGSKL